MSLPVNIVTLVSGQNYKKSYNIGVGLDFGCCTVSLLKRSSCVGECKRANLNQL